MVSKNSSYTSVSRKSYDRYASQPAASRYSRNNADYALTASKKRTRNKKIALGVFAAVLAIFVGCGTAFAVWFDSIDKQLTKGNKSEEELNLINDVLKPKSNPSFTKPFYMMLIGSDRLSDNPDAGARSDTNIVVYVDSSKNQATMVSIPRDTRVEIDGWGIGKFNAAYNSDGAAGAIREASQLLDIDIAHYAEVNFEELKGLVDAVGGVDIVVDERVDDPDADGTSAHPEWPRVIIEEGEQHLNGNQALVFARSRAYLDGDFTRTANQRKLIVAIIDKVLQMPITDLPRVIKSAAASVTTDLSVGDIITLAEQFKDAGDLTIYSAMLPSYTQGFFEGGMEISYVVNDAAATKEMMKAVELGKDPSNIVSSGAPTGGQSIQESNGVGADFGEPINSYNAQDEYVYGEETYSSFGGGDSGASFDPDFSGSGNSGGIFDDGTGNTDEISPPDTGGMSFDEGGTDVALSSND